MGAAPPQSPPTPPSDAPGRHPTSSSPATRAARRRTRACPAPEPRLRDPRAFASVYERHRPGVYGAAYRVLGRPADAEEVTQDVFLGLWSHPERFDPSRGELGPYLRLLGRSRALDRWREQRAAGRTRERLELLAGGEADDLDERPAAAVERAEERAAVRAALRRVPPDQREALVLAYWGGLSHAELAERTGIPLGTAKSRLRAGLARLRAAGPESLDPQPPAAA